MTNALRQMIDEQAYHRSLMGKASRQRILLSCLLIFLLLPISVSGEEEPAWKSNGIDPSTWTDGPDVEDTPMQYSYFGDPVFAIDVTYSPGHFQSEVSGTIVIEMFPQWAPITVENMIEHIEDDFMMASFSIVSSMTLSRNLATQNAKAIVSRLSIDKFAMW